MKCTSHLLVLSMTSLAILGLVPASAYAAELNTTTNLMDEQGPAPAALIPDSEQPRFAKVIDDLPLMPGLQLEQDRDVLFISRSEGRIAETQASGTVDIDDVYRFYRRTLAQMGWKSVDARSFRREGDVLRIDARAEDKQTRVLFSITPADK